MGGLHAAATARGRRAALPGLAGPPSSAGPSCVESLIRSMPVGELDDSRFGCRMRGQAAYAEGIADSFRPLCPQTRSGPFHAGIYVMLFRPPRVPMGRARLFSSVLATIATEGKMASKSLFEDAESARFQQAQPLAARMRRARSRSSSASSTSWAREAAATAAGGRPIGVGDLLRPARHRQDDAGPSAGRESSSSFADQRRGGGVKDLREILPRPGRLASAGARRCCSSTRSIASTRPSRTSCCPTWKTAS